MSVDELRHALNNLFAKIVGAADLALIAPYGSDVRAELETIIGLAEEGEGLAANLLRRYLQVARLWDVSERPVAVKWTRLAAGAENLKEAGNRIVSKGLRPEATRLFLWQDGDSPRERDLFRACVAERAAQGEAQSLLVVNGFGPLFPTPAPPPDLLLGLPALSVDSTGLMLGLFARVRRCIGINGPLLHLASLADTDVEARFGEEDRKWDTSGLNPRMKVEYGA